MFSKVLEEITYSFPNFNGCIVEVREWINNFIQYFKMDAITYPCCKKGPRYVIVILPKTEI